MLRLPDDKILNTTFKLDKFTIFRSEPNKMRISATILIIELKLKCFELYTYVSLYPITMRYSKNNATFFDTKILYT
jgi:hypothetical protein